MPGSVLGCVEVQLEAIIEMNLYTAVGVHGTLCVKRDRQSKLATKREHTKRYEKELLQGPSMFSRRVDQHIFVCK